MPFSHELVIVFTVCVSGLSFGYAAAGAPAQGFEQAPTSTGITIDRILDYGQGTYACVWFETSSAVKVTDAQFAFAWDGYQPGHMGRQVWLLEVWGPFPPPARYYPDPADGGSKDCLRGGGGANPNVVLTGARYQNGTFWHAVPAMPGSAISDAGSGVALASVSAYAGTLPIGWKQSEDQWQRGVPTYECVDLVNKSVKAITHVQVAFTHRSQSGAAIGQSEVLDVRLAIAPGASVQTQCRSFNGRISPSEFHYGASAAKGTPDLKVPNLLFEGSVSVLFAQAIEVDFGDHTSWRASSP